MAKLEIGDYQYHFNIYEDHYICNINTKSDIHLVTFKDILFSKDDLTHFKREILYKGSVRRLFIYNNFQIILKCYKQLPKFIKKLKKKVGIFSS